MHYFNIGILTKLLVCTTLTILQLRKQVLIAEWLCWCHVSMMRESAEVYNMVGPLKIHSLANAPSWEMFVYDCTPQILLFLFSMAQLILLRIHILRKWFSM